MALCLCLFYLFGSVFVCFFKKIKRSGDGCVCVCVCFVLVVLCVLCYVCLLVGFFIWVCCVCVFLIYVGGRFSCFVLSMLCSWLLVFCVGFVCVRVVVLL